MGLLVASRGLSCGSSSFLDRGDDVYILQGLDMSKKYEKGLQNTHTSNLPVRNSRLHLFIQLDSSPLLSLKSIGCRLAWGGRAKPPSNVERGSPLILGAAG